MLLPSIKSTRGQTILLFERLSLKSCLFVGMTVKARNEMEAGTGNPAPASVTLRSSRRSLGIAVSIGPQSMAFGAQPARDYD